MSSPIEAALIVIEAGCLGLRNMHILCWVQMACSVNLMLLRNFEFPVIQLGDDLIFVHNLRLR